jgi:dTDP-4-dehydrorhamnose reductase
MKKVVILGGRGMFAWDMTRILERDTEFTPMPFSRDQVDITDYARVRELILTIKPFAVINTVGPLVDICEDDPGFAYQINVEAVRICAETCQEVGSRFVHLSTCGLFGDQQKFHRENDSVVLKTIYARTKYKGERAALELCPDTLVVRPGWMYGGTSYHKKNFVVARIREAEQKTVLQSAMDKFGNPTCTVDAAEAIRQLLYLDEVTGVVHLTNTGGSSRAGYVRAIIKHAGLDNQVEAVDSSAFPRRASVPDCELLDNSYLNSLLQKPMDDWQNALARYCKTLC